MSTNSPVQTAPPAVLSDRRARLARDLRRPLVVFAGRARARHYATNTYPFRAGSHFLYFCGPPVEGAALLIEPGSDGRNGCTLFHPSRDVEDEVWFGPATPDVALAEGTGLSAAQVVDSERLASWPARGAAGAVCPPCPVTTAWAREMDLSPPSDDEMRAIITLRLIKDEHELAAMRRAAGISVEAQRAAVARAAPGRGEADVHAALLAVYTAHQALPSFTPIITIHGETLHCESYPHRLEAGRLLLIDAAAEEIGGYASDITRTVPVSGTFTAIQRQMYETVLRAQRAAMAACTPGTRFRDVHDLAARTLCEGLVAAELLRGDPRGLAERGAHTLFFTHGLGHLIGLDVHDLEDFGDLAGYPPGRSRRALFGSKFLRLDRDLEPGYTVTVEPGVYLSPGLWGNDRLTAPFADVVNRAKVDALLRDGFGGIRIEDSVHVRAAGSPPEILTAAMPTDPDELCAMVGRA